MQLRTRLSGSIAKRGVAATAAAVLMVGGGVAVAQTGSNADGASEFGLETAEDAIATNADLDIEDLCENQAPDAPFCNGPSIPEPPVEPVEVDVEEFEALDEDPAEVTDAEIVENAAAFSEWVRSIDSDWGCIRGHLVSTAARNGPLNDDFEELTFESPEAAAEWLDIRDHRCVEAVLQPAESDVSELDAAQTADAERPSDAGPPEDTGPRYDEVPPEHANENVPEEAGPPEDAGPPEGARPPDDAGPPSGQGN